MQFASIGTSIQLTCPVKNVNSWQKLDTQDMLASCENGMPITSNKISISDSCDDLIINNFTKKDAGIYRCYVISNDTNTYTYDFSIKIRGKQNKDHVYDLVDSY